MGLQAAHYEPEMDMVEDAEQLDGGTALIH